MAKKFTRTIESFTCENCGLEVKGTGYTNHCPKCLWSKHVDKNPGDRSESCRGMMKSVGVENKGKEFIITHKCEKCGFERKNTFGAGDNFDELVKISKKL
ncbi:MAG: RNHCP domain-containing protein [Patescibacteria group bacterium]